MIAELLLFLVNWSTTYKVINIKIQFTLTPSQFILNNLYIHFHPIDQITTKLKHSILYFMPLHLRILLSYLSLTILSFAFCFYSSTRFIFIFFMYNFFRSLSQNNKYNIKVNEHLKRFHQKPNEKKNHSIEKHFSHTKKRKKVIKQEKRL